MDWTCDVKLFVVFKIIMHFIKISRKLLEKVYFGKLYFTAIGLNSYNPPVFGLIKHGWQIMEMKEACADECRRF